MVIRLSRIRIRSWLLGESFRLIRSQACGNEPSCFAIEFFRYCKAFSLVTKPKS